ncbi:MAG TPA: 50S ribosomal protein L6 [Verrucomicrobia bacterium]|nr:MAG: 50S ribosomal protein L6 [Lentisphaerae bacterium GWF2_57_35]HBA83565.1 50S ribosomal protein L6 [Verrucomicrobiota bacterium]
MSRIGKTPVPVPNGVTVAVNETTVTVKGSKGELSLSLPAKVSAKVNGDKVEILCSPDDKQAKADWGTTRSLIANMIEGVSKGYSKELEIQGVGFRAALQGKKLVLSLGYSHPIEFIVPDAIKVNVVDSTAITVSGIDKHLVGEVSARIRAYCPPEPYKGKGVRYKGEYVRRKVGKTVA